MKKKRIILSIVAAFLIIVLLLFSVEFIFSGDEDFNAVNNSERVERMPYVLDSNTRIDSVLTVGNSKSYYLTFDLKGQNINLEEYRELIRQNLIDGIKRNPEYEKWKKANLEFNYIYYDKDGNEILNEYIPSTIY